MSQFNPPWDPARTQKGVGPLARSETPGPTQVDFSRYRLGSRLGSTGQVYEAYNPRFPGRLVVKLFPFAVGASPEAVAAFTLEAGRVADLRHPHIVQVFHPGTFGDGTPFVAMERLFGQTLEEQIASRGALPVSELLPIVRGLASALSAAHAVGVFHRELRANNVFIADVVGYEMGFAKILDFGVSRLTAAARAAGRIVGVGGDHILAPEQRQDPHGIAQHVANELTDQFALAALTYRLLTGVDPFAGQGGSAEIDRLREGGARSPVFFGQCAPAIEAVLDRALARRPEDRYESVAHFFHAFEQGLVRTSGIATPGPVGHELPVVERPARPANDLVAADLPADPADDPRADHSAGLAAGLAAPTQRLASVRSEALTEQLERPGSQRPPTRPRIVATTAVPGIPASSLTQQFFVEGDRQEASQWDDSPLAAEVAVDERALAFDSFDRVPKRRAPLIGAALLVVAGLGITAWVTGWLSPVERVSEGIGKTLHQLEEVPSPPPTAERVTSMNDKPVARIPQPATTVRAPELAASGARAPAAGAVGGLKPAAGAAAAKSTTTSGEPVAPVAPASSEPPPRPAPPSAAVAQARPVAAAAPALSAPGTPLLRILPQPMAAPLRTNSPPIRTRTGVAAPVAQPPANDSQAAAVLDRPSPLRGYVWSPERRRLIHARLPPLQSESPPAPSVTELPPPLQRESANP
jgi:serine/threonine protein kinase